MLGGKTLPRRDFLRNAVMLAGTGVTAPLWAAMKYDRNAAMRYFREQASETDARVKAGIEANRKGDATLVFTDAQGRPCERVHVKVRQLRHDFKYGANLFGLAETGLQTEIVAHGNAAIAAAHAYAARRDLFASIYCCHTPSGWAESVREGQFIPFANVVNGALLDYDWTDLIRQ